MKLFRGFIPASIVGLVFSEFLLIYFCYAGAFLALDWLAYAQSNPLVALDTDYEYLKIAIVVASVMAGMYFQDLYTKIHVHSGVLVFQQVCTAIGIAIAIQGLLTYLLQGEWSTSRWAMLSGSFLTLLLIPPWRMFYSAVVLKAVGSIRMLFLGTSYAIQEIAKQLIEQPEVGMQNLGYVDNEEDRGQFPGGKILGGVSELADLAEELKPDVIVVGLEEQRQHMLVDQMLRLRFSGIRFEEAPATFEATFGRILTRHLQPSQLIFSTDLGQRRRNPFWHTAYSLLFTVILIVIFAPVMLAVAILVRITSRGPVLLRQERVGLNGATFTLYKFRSMHANAEAGTGAVWAKRGDPRVTPIGKWLRALRLDEIPQLFNVLRGEMLLVGPRPERPEFVHTFEGQIPFYGYRHAVKPGITGWAQINYKYGATLEDTIVKLEYDLYYIKNRSLSLDTLIILRTLKVMLFSGLGH
jgi:exopolysaccharide biosynthesis polyprenyl glycosylphosphotransferase